MTTLFSPQAVHHILTAVVEYTWGWSVKIQPLVFFCYKYWRIKNEQFLKIVNIRIVNYSHILKSSWNINIDKNNENKNIN